jgi:hypothetical protein
MNTEYFNLAKHAHFNPNQMRFSTGLRSKLQVSLFEVSEQ